MREIKDGGITTKWRDNKLFKRPYPYLDIDIYGKTLVVSTWPTGKDYKILFYRLDD